MSKPVLLTGFEPFGKHRVNSSWEASRLVRKEMAAHVIARRLPVDYLAARERLYVYLARHRPAICLCTGLTSSPLSGVERLARKPVQFAEIEGPEVLYGAWPWDEAEEALRKAARPAILSEDAGQYVCESTYWALLAFRLQFGYPAYAAFLHVPPLSPDLTAETIAAAVSGILRARLNSAPELARPKRRRPHLEHPGRSGAMNTGGKP